MLYFNTSSVFFQCRTIRGQFYPAPDRNGKGRPLFPYAALNAFRNMAPQMSIAVSKRRREFPPGLATDSWMSPASPLTAGDVVSSGIPH